MVEPLDKKYRPSNLDEVIGNESVIKSLKSLLDSKRPTVPSSFLLYGPSGCGKTTLSRIIAELLGAVGMDVKELNISKEGGKAEAQKIIDSTSLSAWGGKDKSKVIILNEVHGASKHFQNAMLEIMEHPPVRTHFILCTTEPEKLLPAVKSRCVKYSVSSLGKREMIKLVSRTLDGEEKELSGEVINAIIKGAEGSPRDALILIDTVIDIDGDEDKLNIIKDLIGSGSNVKLYELYKAVIDKASWGKVRKMLLKLDVEPESARYYFLTVIAKDLLRADEERAMRLSAIGQEFEESFMYSKKFGLVNACYMATQI